MEHVLSINNITKNYGRITAVSNMSLDVSEGSVFGILGPNGSGKTTTLGIILDVINPTDGTFNWFRNFTRKENRQKIGSTLETPAFYPYLTGVQNLKIIADIKRINYDNIDKVLKDVGLYERKDYKYKTYSLGMKQRLAVASALLCDPKVMVLDEPTNGLDPQGIAEIREVIKDISKKGKTVILASHLLDEVQKVCTDFAVLNFGRLIYSGKVDEVSQEQQIVEVSSQNLTELEKAINKFSLKKSYDNEKDKIIVTLDRNMSVTDLNKYLVESGIIVTHLVVRKRSLEQKFLDILNESE
ncbi:MAG: ATP-binding cassette domain-containing protein [Bacteroidales bacterium]|nr:MAG: ATP-binding cassette domain-containing protein [Bacteroidales bacterium]